MHARGLKEANEELVEQRIDLMVQLAHLEAFLTNADKHERKLRVGSCYLGSLVSYLVSHYIDAKRRTLLFPFLSSPFLSSPLLSFLSFPLK